MNFKLNLWTLLFVLTAGAWFFTSFGKDSKALSLMDNALPYNSWLNYGIDTVHYFEGRAEYSHLMDCIDTTCTIATGGAMLPSVPAAAYYKIQRAEIDSFSQHISGDYFYIVPIIDEIRKDTTAGYPCSKMISLAFTTQRPSTHPDSVYNATARIYNFATPCPPLCDNQSGPAYFCNSKANRNNNKDN